MDKELYFSYLGQEREARQLLLDEKLATSEEAALMTAGEVADTLLTKYEVVSRSDETIVLVKSDDIETYKKITKTLYR